MNSQQYKKDTIIFVSKLKDKFEFWIVYAVFGTFKIYIMCLMRVTLLKNAFPPYTMAN